MEYYIYIYITGIYIYIYTQFSDFYHLFQTQKPKIQAEVGDYTEEPSGGHRTQTHAAEKSNVPQDYTFITQNKSPLNKRHMHN